MTTQRKTYNKSLVNIQACFYDDKEIKTIVKICDLHPVNWRRWVSPLGLTLLIKDKTIKISTKKSVDNLISSDIYLHAKIDYLMFKTKILSYYDGYLMLWGDDDLLRTFRYSSDICDWERVCPLEISLDIIRRLVRFQKKDLTHDDELPYNWLACQIPVTTESYQYLQRKNKEICQHRLQTLIEGF